MDHENPVLAEVNTLSADKAIMAAMDLSETLFHSFATFEERLTIVYSVTSNLMQLIFDSMNEKLPLAALQACITQLVECTNLETTSMPLFLKIIPDEYTTHHHSTNVAFLAVILAHSINLSYEEKIDIGYTGLLHDIGKIRIDAQLLLKPSRLSNKEYEAVKRHSDYGYMILQDNGIVNQKILNGVRFHHERLDGSGYPKGLRSKLIPKYAQIIGMCDAFDALTAKRTFRNHYTSYEALLTMKQEMASQFNKDYTTPFIQLLGGH